MRSGKGPIVAEHMAIGHDLNLFLDAAEIIIKRRTWSGNPFRVINQNTIQRHVRVGWVKAGLLLLLEDYGIVIRCGAARFDFAVEPDVLEVKLAEIRAAHALEATS